MTTRQVHQGNTRPLTEVPYPRHAQGNLTRDLDTTVTSPLRNLVQTKIQQDEEVADKDRYV
jgi:hypothetical protein